MLLNSDPNTENLIKADQCGSVRVHCGSDCERSMYVAKSLTFMNSSSGQGRPLYMMSGEMISTSSRASCLQPSPVYKGKTGYELIWSINGRAGIQQR